MGTKVVAKMQNGALRTAVVARARGVAGKYVINPRRAGQKREGKSQGEGEVTYSGQCW